MKEELKVLNKNEKVQANESGLGIALASENSHSSFFTLRSSFTKSTLGGGRKTNNMKKLMIAASAAFCAAVGLADVTSANVVGYNTVDINPGYNMFAVNFKTVGDDAGVAIDDLFPGGGKADTIFTASSGSDSADYIMVWDNARGEYNTYFLYYVKKGGTAANKYWWCNTDGSGKAADQNVKFKNGDAFWFYKRGDQKVTATTSGEVELSDMKEIDIKPGYNMIGSFFPTGWTINDDKYYTPDFWSTSGAQVGSGSDSADSLMVWDNSKNEYDTYFLYYVKKGGTADWKNKWCNTDGTGPAVGNVMTPGKGAWYYHRGSGFKLPVKKQF